MTTANGTTANGTAANGTAANGTAASGAGIPADRVIGWIGTGSIGHRMAGHLARAGYRLICADAASTERAPEGAAIAAGNAEVAAAAELVILSLPDGAATLAVCADLIGAAGRRTRCVIDTSTIGTEAAEHAAARCAAAGIDYVDAPVSGGIAGADKATLAVMMACPAASFAALSPLLRRIGSNVFHVGEHPGQGQTVKLLNNFLSATAMAATSEAVAFGTARGLDMATILAVVNASSGQNTATADKFPNRILPGRYDGGFLARLLHKDVRLYAEAVRATGTAGRIGGLVETVWAELAAAGPEADFTEIYRLVRDGALPAPAEAAED